MCHMEHMGLITGLILLFHSLSPSHAVPEYGITVGTVKNCTKITAYQAPFAVKWDRYEGCCIHHANKISVSSFKRMNKIDTCCIPVGKECDIKFTECCNQLLCLDKEGTNMTTCQQRKDAFLINSIREGKESCADPKRSLHVLLDVTLIRKDKEEIRIKDSSYCCKTSIRGKTRIARLDRYCCGTAFALCETFDPKHRYKYPPHFRCCGGGGEKNTNCGAHTLSTNPIKPIKIEELQNMKYVAKKTKSWFNEIKSVPMPAREGYGFCHYVTAGRFDVTKNLDSKAIGSDLKSYCDQGRIRYSRKENEVKCPSERPYMYQFQDTSNVCCKSQVNLHEADESKIHKDCCISNFLKILEAGDKDPRKKHGDSYCSKVPQLACCSGSCVKGSPCAKGNTTCEKRDLCSGIPDDIRVDCSDDFLFDVSDDDYMRELSDIAPEYSSKSQKCFGCPDDAFTGKTSATTAGYKFT